MPASVPTEGTEEVRLQCLPFFHNPMTPEMLDARDSLRHSVIEENRLTGVNENIPAC